MNTIKLPITAALVQGALIAVPAARIPARAAIVFDLTTRLRSGWGRKWKAQSNPFDVTVPAAPVLHLS